MDLSLKHAYLPKDLQSVQTPYNVYISVSSASSSPAPACMACSRCYLAVNQQALMPSPPVPWPAHPGESGAGECREGGAGHWQGLRPPATLGLSGLESLHAMRSCLPCWLTIIVVPRPSRMAGLCPTRARAGTVFNTLCGATLARKLCTRKQQTVQQQHVPGFSAAAPLLPRQPCSWKHALEAQLPAVHWRGLAAQSTAHDHHHTQAQ
jgi:hypothetical protein